MKKKITLAVICAVLSCVCLIGTTFAWLTDSTDPITNTFTVGDIEITLAETTGTSYKMVPGATISKNPKVTVLGDSEDCYLFIKIDETNNTFDTNKKFVEYVIAAGWTALSGEDGVYYRTVANSADDQGFPVLLNDQVTINTAATATHLEAAETNKPTLSFTAYAVQQLGFDDAADAWAVVDPTP